MSHPQLIVGLPHLSRGPLLYAAQALKAPVMISAGALGKWEDEGQVLPGHEFNLLEMTIRRLTGDTRPPTPAQKRRRVRRWTGWNTGALDRVEDLGLEIHIDSAGFVAMAMHGGYFWTPESYIFDLCTHRSIKRFSAMDLCVEQEVAKDRLEVDERIAKTIHLNFACARHARTAGISDKLMPVIQGATAEDYLRCFDRISSIVQPGATIGVGSMCRRPTKGPEGSNAVLEILDRELPKDVRLHLFGLKSDGAEAACIFGNRIDSVDSQSYGIRARRIANDERAKDPSFSKTNVFLAKVMSDWYRGQMDRLANPRPFMTQPEFSMPADNRPISLMDAMERIAHAELNELIAQGELSHDQIIGGRMLEECIMGIAHDLPEGVKLTDRWRGSHQLPSDLLEQSWFPEELAA